MTTESPYASGKLPARLAPRLEVLLCAAFAVILLWSGIVPAWRTLNTDFPNYYLVARLFHEGYSLDRIYDWIWLQRIKDHWGLDQSLVGFAGLTPLSALPIVPLAIFSVLTAKRIWIVINLTFLAAGVELLHRSTALGRRRVWLITLLAVLPLRTNFLYGQMHLFVLFLMVLAYFFHRRDRAMLCGICIALAGVLKVYPLLFVLYFLWKRQWRPALAEIGALIAIAVAGGFAMGGNSLRIYALEMLPRSLQGETLDPYSMRAASGAALFHRLFLYEPSLNPSPFFSSSTLYAIVYPLWQITILFPLFALLRPSTSREREQMEWASFLFALLLLSPVPSTYHFVVMILPVVLFIDALKKENRRDLIVAVLLLFFLISTSGFLSSISRFGAGFNALLAFSRLWLAIALFVFFLVGLSCDRSKKLSQYGGLRFALLSIFTIAALISSIAGYRHHFSGREQEMSRRLMPPSATLLATLPRSDAGDNLFVGMMRDGYRISNMEGPVMDEARASDLHNRRHADELSFALSPDHALFVELADSSGSRIVRALDHSLVVQDAESPKVSGDGSQLAFIREHKGRGSLWTVPIGLSNGDPRSQPVRLTSDDYDVRDQSLLHSGASLFLARHEGQTSLFTVNASGAPVLFFSPGAEIASFAVSPDERRIVFTELIHNRWQVAVLDTLSRHVTAITTADCNAYTPTWSTGSSLVYATDCGRGVGLTALASVSMDASR